MTSLACETVTVVMLLCSMTTLKGFGMDMRATEGWANVPAQLANTGGSFLLGLSFVIFALMFLWMLGDAIFW